MFSFAKFAEFRDLFNEVGQYGAFTDTTGVTADWDSVSFKGIKVLEIKYNDATGEAKIYLNEEYGLFQNKTSDPNYFNRPDVEAMQDKVSILMKCIYAFMIKYKPQIADFSSIRWNVMRNYDLNSDRFGGALTTPKDYSPTVGKYEQPPEHRENKARFNKVFDVGAKQVAAAVSRELGQPYGVTHGDRIVNERGFQDLHKQATAHGGTGTYEVSPDAILPISGSDAAKQQQAMTSDRYARERARLAQGKQGFGALFGGK